MGDRTDGNLDEATPDLSEAPGQRTFSRPALALCGNSFSRFPTPDRHLVAMFGTGITASVLMLIVMPFYFYGFTDVDTQTSLEARYRVDINCPRWAEFANLPSIGEKTAKAIVTHGQEVGGFGSIDQLLEVKGIGAKTLAKIQPFLVIAADNDKPQQRNLPKTLLNGD